MKEIILDNKERELVARAREAGFKDWSYRSWRTTRKTRRHGMEEYSLTKSIANDGEWSFVQKFSDGTRVKTTTCELGYLIFVMDKMA